MNLINLKRMYNHILLNVPEENINMKIYRNNDEQKTHECQSTGCVIGHCIILDDWKNLQKNNSGEIIFGKWSESFTGLERFSEEWYWCFSGKWPNDKKQILLRLKYFIDNQDYPNDWIYESESNNIYKLTEQKLELYELD